MGLSMRTWEPSPQELRTCTFHDWGKIVTDLAVAVALGGDYLADARHGALDDQCGHPSTFRVTDGMQGKERFVAEGRVQPVYRRIADKLRTAILEGPIGRETSCPAKTS
jgi:hypothetical protein